MIEDPADRFLHQTFSVHPHYSFGFSTSVLHPPPIDHWPLTFGHLMIKQSLLPGCGVDTKACMSWCGHDGRFLLICLCSVCLTACLFPGPRPLPSTTTYTCPALAIKATWSLSAPLQSWIPVSFSLRTLEQPASLPTSQLVFLQTLVCQQLFHWIHLLHSPQTNSTFTKDKPVCIYCKKHGHTFNTCLKNNCFPQTSYLMKTDLSTGRGTLRNQSNTANFNGVFSPFIMKASVTLTDGVLSSWLWSWRTEQPHCHLILTSSLNSDALVLEFGL